MNINKECILDEIVKISAILGNPISIHDIWINDLGCPHKLPALRDLNVSSVYMFFYQGNALKIGKADINSHARYAYQHYNVNGAKNSLWNSLKTDQVYNVLLGEQDIGKWIKMNCRRVDIHLSKNVDSLGLNLVEALMLHKFQPYFENRVTRM